MAVGRQRRIDRPAGADPGRARLAFDEHARCSSSANDAGSSQNEMLFMRGNAMSGAPIISGTIQLPKPPIIAGITMKKIMMRPCPVVNTLNMWASPKICRPGCCSSSRMRDRQHAADHAAHHARTPGTSCRCPCGWSNRRSGATRSGYGAPRAQCAVGIMGAVSYRRCHGRFLRLCPLLRRRCSPCRLSRPWPAAATASGGALSFLA